MEEETLGYQVIILLMQDMEWYYGSGGGATDIRRVKATEGKWYDEAHEDWIKDKSLLSRIIVAGGGRTDGIGEAGGGSTTSGASQNSGYQFGLGQNGANGINAPYQAEGSAGSGGGYYGGTAPTNPGQSGGRGGSGFVGNLIEGRTVSGNEEMPSHDGETVMVGNVDGGYAKITFLGYKD